MKKNENRVRIEQRKSVTIYNKIYRKHQETWAWQQEDNEKWKKNMEKSI